MLCVAGVAEMKKVETYLEEFEAKRKAAGTSTYSALETLRITHLYSAAPEEDKNLAQEGEGLFTSAQRLCVLSTDVAEASVAASHTARPLTREMLSGDLFQYRVCSRFVSRKEEEL